jgi:UDP-N-acetylmuramoyl-tripeptide--D-alanyl-D-alanine ligase
MKPIDLQTFARFAKGEILSGDGSLQVTEVTTDSRRVVPGQVFVALSGEKFDGHHYVPDVAKAGAAAVLVHRTDAGWGDLGCAVIKCEDTLTGLQNAAGAYREWHNPYVISITGSNGKTTTKDLTCMTLSPKYQVRATAGNLNNHIGVPLSLLSLREGDNCGVFELGMNHPGEIAPLAALARPDGAVITNIGVAHIEHMGSREAIALEKGMLAEAVGENGFVVLNANDDFTHSIAKRTRARVITAGLGAGDVAARELSESTAGTRFTVDLDGQQEKVFLPIPGRHMVINATLALAVAWQSGVALDAAVHALAEVRITKGRLDVREVRGVTFLDDSYNANPDSMKAGLTTLAGLDAKGRKVAVLGRMGELGPHARSGHEEVGTHAAELGLDAVFTVGDEAHWIVEKAASGCDHVATYSNHDDCVAALREWLKAGDLVLVKGSRSSAMEKIITLFDQA